MTEKQVVTRYFGGTKLGTGGLVKAYTECAQVEEENYFIPCHLTKFKASLLSSKTVERVFRVKLDVSGVDYSLYAKLRSALEALGGIIEDESFGEDVSFSVSVGQFGVEARRLSLRIKTSPIEDFRSDPSIMGQAKLDWVGHRLAYAPHVPPKAFLRVIATTVGGFRSGWQLLRRFLAIPCSNPFCPVLFVASRLVLLTPPSLRAHFGKPHIRSNVSVWVAVVLGIVL
eukprot:745938-Hanusia_phi.AAC.1